MKKPSFFLLGVAGAILLLANLFFLQDPIVGGAGLITYLAGVSRAIGTRINSTHTPLEQWFFGFLTLLSTLILLNTISYYIFGVTRATAVTTLLLPLTVFFLHQKNHEQKQTPKKKGGEEKRSIPYLLLGFIALEIGLFGLLAASQTTGLLRSAWHAIEPNFFVAYALATGLLFYVIRTARRHRTAILYSFVHFFLTLSVAAIIYPLGFGFDAFIHRATELWIVEYGAITPKTPYYIGQYALVAFTARLTGMSVFFVDVFLVPFIAALTLPIGAGLWLKSIWNIPFRRGLLLAWMIPFVPFLNDYLHLTTPFNLAFLLAILSVFATLAYIKNQSIGLIPLLLGASALASHALVGAPLAVFVVGAMLLKKSAPRARLPIITLAGFGMLLAAPMLFGVRNALLGLELPSIQMSVSTLTSFFELFQRPYWYAKNAPLIFELLYAWAWCIVPIVTLLAFIGLYAEKKDRHIPLFFLTGAVGTFLSAWLLRTSIVFPDVVAYEQGDFPLRLAKLSLVFLLPFAMHGIYVFTKKISKKKLLAIGYWLLAIILLTLSLYLSYPQHNPKARFPGLNVTSADVEAVQWIHDRHDTYEYVVLSNQLTSAAALTEYSFAKYFETDKGDLFYYAIPTGGPLYRQYGRMLYEGQQREYMETAMDLVGVDTAYFVINAYWANANEIIDGAKQTADSWHVIEDGAIWIFVYQK